VGSFEDADNSVAGGAISEVAMKVRLLIFLTAIVLATGSALAIMNNDCKSSHHTWCAPMSSIRHQVHLGSKT
jgi:hypothetical protein